MSQNAAPVDPSEFDSVGVPFDPVAYPPDFGNTAPAGGYANFEAAARAALANSASSSMASTSSVAPVLPGSRTLKLSPAALAGVTGPDGKRHVGPEGADIIARMRAYFISLGKTQTADGYSRHLSSLFSYAENHGHTVRALPATIVEDMIRDLRAGGQSESTLYIMRTQMKSALAACHNNLGIDFSRIEYETGKPPKTSAARTSEKEARKHRRDEELRLKAQAVALTQQGNYGLHGAGDSYMSDVQTAHAGNGVMAPVGIPIPAGTTPGGTIFVQMPPPVAAPPARPMSTIGAPPKAAPAAVVNGMQIGSQVFTGPYVRISRINDGSEGLSAPGSESFITMVPLATLRPYGDVAQFMLQFQIPKMRLSPQTSRITFAFYELNSNRQPTNKRDEVIVEIPLADASGSGTFGHQQAPAMQGGFNGYVQSAPFGGFVDQNGVQQPQFAPPNFNPTQALVEKLDKDAEASRQRSEKLQDEMRAAQNAQQLFWQQQQFQKEQELKAQIDAQRQQLSAPAVPQMFLPQMSVEPPGPSPTELMLKAMMEQQAAATASTQRMFEMMMSQNQRPSAPPPDPMAYLVPMLTAQQAQASNQAIESQKLLVAMMTRPEPGISPALQIVLSELKEARQLVAPPKDAMMDFAEKLQQMQQVSGMLGGASESPGLVGLISEALQNADGISKLVGAIGLMRAGTAPTVTLPKPAASAGPVVQTPAAAEAQVQQQSQQGANAPPAPPPPPQATLEALGFATAAVNEHNDEKAINAVVTYITALSQAPAPYNRFSQQMLGEFGRAEEEADLYALTKNLWIAVGQPIDRKAAKALAEILTRWYSEIHVQVFQTERSLAGASEESKVDGAVVTPLIPAPAQPDPVLAAMEVAAQAPAATLTQPNRYGAAPEPEVLNQPTAVSDHGANGVIAPSVAVVETEDDDEEDDLVCPTNGAECEGCDDCTEDDDEQPAAVQMNGAA